MTTPRNVEIDVFADDLSERYLISPNELHRGEGVYAGLTGDERCLLAALLTMRKGHKTNKDRINRILPDVGETKRERIIRTLRERGFLTVEQYNDPERRGRFAYRWRVYMSPLPEDQRDNLREKKTAGGTMPQNPRHGETAGGTTPQSPRPGEPRHGEPRDGDPRRGQDRPYKEEKNHVQKDQVLEDPEGEKTPPTPAEDDAAGAAPAGPDGGDSLSTDDKATLNAAAAYALEHRDGQPGWKRDQVVDAIRAQLDAGHPPAAVAQALRKATDDREGTSYPGRIGYLLSAAAKAPDAAAAPWTEGPIKHLDPAVPRCKRHPGQPAGTCGGCKADAVAVDRDDNDQAPALARTEARRLAAERIAAGKRKIHGKDKQTRAAAALVELTAAATEVTGRPVVDQVADLEVPAQRAAADLVGAR